MQSDIMFDNIYIGQSVEDAEKLKAETFDIKHPIEVEEETASKPKAPEPPKSAEDITFMEDPVTYIRQKVDLFWSIAQNDPVQAVKMLPEVAGGIGALAVTVIALIAGIIGMSGGSSSPQVKKTAEKAKQSATDVKDQAVDATSTGAEKVQAEINKRTTRSSGPAE